LNTDIVYRALSEQIGEDRLEKNARMAEHTSFMTGGKAAVLVIPGNVGQLRFAMKVIAEEKAPFFIMGNGTNLLVRDGGYRGVIVKIGGALSDVIINDGTIEAGAGALIKYITDKALEKGLTGLEFAAGIPGSAGGAAYMNAGAYDGEMSRVIERVDILKSDGSDIYSLSSDEMGYGYRTSKLMATREVILSVTFQLTAGNRDDIALKMNDFNSRRKQKQPLDYPSAGSFFKRPPGNYAGTLIEKAGLRGTSVGGAMVSMLHAGFIVNTGGATATDILALMKLVQEKVLEHSGIMLEPEVRIIGEQDGFGA